ncbi:hypothetical protein [Arthrobacter sp. 260]|uniref:hypothetical protein n=1 Tax=Arthrobacter sp. 260 TaxID=2735314 RepID=UPI001E608399|nr:hypothetical protein [Arthrobacter sp. 260]
MLEKLMAVVRPEFRVDIYLPDPDDPVLGRKSCLVPECDRCQVENGLCSAHGWRRRQRGRSEMEVFLADPGPELNGRRDLSTCSVTGCRYGSSGSGLCQRHRSVWTRAGQPDLGQWAAGASLIGPSVPAECLLRFCSLWTENAKHLYCKSHATRWAQLGRPSNADYIEHCQRRGKAYIDFRGLAPQLKLELQYAVQCRHDQATLITTPSMVTWTLRNVKDVDVRSLLDLTQQQWRELAGPKEGTYHRFLAFSREKVETLHEGSGWEVEYPRDVWRLHLLPGLTAVPGKRPHSRINLRFDRLLQSWLRSLAKRWARLRLSSGLSPSTVSGDIQGLRRFSTFLAETTPGIEALADINREVLERYLAWLATQPFGRGAKEDAITAPGAFFQAIRQHGWDETLPTTAVFFPGDIPARPAKAVRHVAEHIMTQVEAPANLDRWPNPGGRLITLI